MSRRRSSRSVEEADDSAATRSARLVDEVRSQVGFIITAEAAEELITNPPTDAGALTDALVVAGGNDPLLVDEAVRRSVRKLVDARLV